MERAGFLRFDSAGTRPALGREPRRWLQPGDQLASWVGEIRQRFAAAGQ